MHIIILISVLTADPNAGENMPRHTVKEVQQAAASAAQWKVLVLGGKEVEEERYVLNDEQIMKRLAGLLVTVNQFEFEDSGVALDPHVYVDLVPPKNAKSQAIKLEVVGDSLYLIEGESRYLADLKSQSLYKRLAFRDFEFSEEIEPEKSSPAEKVDERPEADKQRRIEESSVRKRRPPDLPELQRRKLPSDRLARLRTELPQRDRQ